MIKIASPRVKTNNPIKQKSNFVASNLAFSPKLSVLILATCATLFIIFQIQSLHTPLPPSSTSHPQQSWALMNQLQNLIHTTQAYNHCTQVLNSLATKLSQSVTFLPLKDLRYAQTALQGHTWFMSSMYDTQIQGEVQFEKFPSNSSLGRVLCIKGRDTHDGARNSYALAWPEFLPYNATFFEGLTYVSYNHYNYDNIWHGLSAMVPFVAWHIKEGCKFVPNRWILYHWGEIRSKMGPWLGSLMEATFDGPIKIETFDGLDNDGPYCFGEAVVMRHNEGGMSRERRLEVYDLMRCKARTYCNVSSRVSDDGVSPLIGMTMFMRTGARSFENESAVIEIFGRECSKVEGCQLLVAYSNNLSFCEQVKLMSKTDILISPHGAQLTNMFFMDRNSSVMEFFPKGWLKLAGVGQYVYHWIASWSGMRHQGAWRDPNGPHCPYSGDDRRCMSIYKGSKIGFNATFFAEWVTNVLSEVKIRKLEEASHKRARDKTQNSRDCACRSG